MVSKVARTRAMVIILCLMAGGAFYKSKWNLASGYWSRPLQMCNCDKCLAERDKELKDILDVSPKPFLSKWDRTSEDEFNWWKHLQFEKRPFSVFNEIVDRLFTIFPSVPDVEGPSPYRCRKCAVVGNSGNLKGSGYGKLINDHDIVIRMNHGRTKGYEEDVGTKTTHHVMYPESAVYLDNSTHLVLFSFKINDLLWLLRTFTPRENGQENPEKRGNKNLVMMLNPAFMKYVHEVWLKGAGRYPSTGFMVFVLSLQMCDEVSVFGFGANQDGNWHHYFEKMKINQMRIHHGIQEYEMIQQLHQKQIIRFFKGL
nr:CMP-N-acetylneuraminate-beta-galactosamide-alpha-2,3-sialyltransferase 1-like isoform X2 [Doryrhamphus excisus]XP_057902646.1 CMP-N-acetylneuraminate-beta-galactosamide-alpha-2,3-sialyltransferase 1-like isoform X2 [Doryrhamphus excisus]